MLPIVEGRNQDDIRAGCVQISAVELIYLGFNHYINYHKLEALNKSGACANAEIKNTRIVYMLTSRVQYVATE